jgi:hypothetical protein
VELEHLKIETRLIDEKFANVMGENPCRPFRHLCCLVVYYESIKRELKKRCIYECRCDERLQTKTKEFTRLTHTGLVVELEHLEIETRLIDEKFEKAMGEYVP